MIMLIPSRPPRSRKLAPNKPNRTNSVNHHKRVSNRTSVRIVTEVAEEPISVSVTCAPLEHSIPEMDKASGFPFAPVKPSTASPVYDLRAIEAVSRAPAHN